MTDSSEHNRVAPFEVAPAETHEAKAEELNEQRLRLTAARDRIDHAAKLLAHGGDWDQAYAYEELRLARRTLDEDQTDGM